MPEHGDRLVLQYHGFWDLCHNFYLTPKNGYASRRIAL